MTIRLSLRFICINNHKVYTKYSQAWSITKLTVTNTAGAEFMNETMPGWAIFSHYDSCNMHRNQHCQHRYLFFLTVWKSVVKVERWEGGLQGGSFLLKSELLRLGESCSSIQILCSCEDAIGSKSTQFRFQNSNTEIGRFHTLHVI